MRRSSTKKTTKPTPQTTAAKPDTQATPEHEHTRTGMSTQTLIQAFNDNLFYLQGRFYDVATLNDQYMAAAYTVRDRLLARWIQSAQAYKNSGVRTVCYLSAEFLLGPHLGNNMINLDIMDKAKQAAEEMNLDLQAIMDQEVEPGLGNGGLGRLAACYMDSLATLQIPAIGYGIRYEFGIFDQKIENGWQKEVTDMWLRSGNPWELPRPKLRFQVKFGGHTEQYQDQSGQLKVRWHPSEVINGMAYDTPILGYGVNNVNLLRLWKSEACESFDFSAFNKGDYYGAVHAKMVAENISKVLYPNDEAVAGKELRLKQQYFFVSCSLQDMMRLHFKQNNSVAGFEKKFAAQLNDTHPAVAVAELMRLLLDDYEQPWDAAWDITRNTFAYTNHTLLPEALETWSVDLFKRLLPRHLEIIYEINRRFLDEVRLRFLNDEARLARMSLIDEGSGQRVRMANLACVGSFAINGVAALHTELLKSTILRDFYEFFPDKFSNKTNGVTPRRFLMLSNPRLANLLTDTVGDGWQRDLMQLRGLEQSADDSAFQQQWQAVKRAAKQDLANCLANRTGEIINPDSLFDVQAKRIHEYKRQHLNVLHIIALYEWIKQNPNADITPRTFIFGGKAAPGYYMAKLIIKLINSVGMMINRDPQVQDKLKVVFMPNFNVKNSQHVYPSADLSEQISTAGKEASGTGNMKFSMNGALTIGTLDGANIEIREEVGSENFFLFGMNAEQVEQQWRDGYHPHQYYEADEQLRNAINMIQSGFFSHGDADLFKPLVDNLLQHDPYLVLADFRAYMDCQNQVGKAYADTKHWMKMSILNVARIGKFSSDRSIKEYCEDIWKVEPCNVETDCQ